MKCLIKVDISVHHRDKTPCICCFGEFNKPVIWGEVRRRFTQQTKQGVTNEIRGITNSLCFNSYNTFEFSKHFGVTKHLLWINSLRFSFHREYQFNTERINRRFNPVSLSQPIVLLFISTKGTYHLFNFVTLNIIRWSAEQLHVKIQFNFYVKENLHLWFQSHKFKTVSALDKSEITYSS